MGHKKEHKLSIIIPVFNEEESIDDVLTELSVVLSQYEIFYEIVVVNDNSTDSTPVIVNNHIHQNSNIFLVDNQSGLGLGRCF